jgi:hypothetical protein
MTTSNYTPPEVPGNLPAAIRETKDALRRSIGDYEGAFRYVEEKMRNEVAEIIDLRSQGDPVWPVVNFSDIAAGTVSDDLRSLIRRRGCAIVKGTFRRERAEAWDQELASYLDRNDFFGQYRNEDDGFFGTVENAKPSIFPIYWSTPQIEARQDDAMALTRQFLNSFWQHESLGRVWFDPNRDTHYPDRIRRRPPGTTSTGLSPHTDAGAVERWLTPQYQSVFRHVFDGHIESYDPWDGAYRSEALEYNVPRRCSVFRTFQGWTALSDMAPTQGVLHAIPIPDAMSYQLLRALQDDVADDELCGAAPGKTMPTTEKWHPELWAGLTAIPAVEPGDTVWWHGDLIHAVGGVRDQLGWGNVMYIPSSPWCEKNAAYAAACGEDFVTGVSPRDFAHEDYEVSWTGRATLAHLNDRGRQQLGLA